MIEHLFGSKTRFKLLKIFFAKTQDKFFVRELTRKAETQINAVRRELKNLLSAEIIIAEGDGGGRNEFEEYSATSKRKYFKLNINGPLTMDLEALLIKDRIAREQKFINSLKELRSLDYLLLSGRFVGIFDTPADLLLVGNFFQKKLERILKIFEKEIGEEIRYTIMKPKEFIYRRDVADKFLSDLLSRKNIILVDKISGAGKMKIF